MLTTFEPKVVQRSVIRLTRFEMHPDVDWHQEGSEEGLKECRFGKTRVLKSHGDRTNTFGVANGGQEMSVLITNSLHQASREMSQVLDESISSNFQVIVCLNRISFEEF